MKIEVRDEMEIGDSTCELSLAMNIPDSADEWVQALVRAWLVNIMRVLVKTRGDWTGS